MFRYIFIVLFFIGCSEVSLPQTSKVDSVNNNDIKDLKSTLNIYPKDLIAYQSILDDKKDLSINVGDSNMYGIEISRELKIAYDSYLSGDGETALEALKTLKEKTKDTKLLWQISFLEIKTYIMLGLGDDAVAQLPQCIQYEKESFNSSLNCISLRGELNLWLENYEEAKKDSSFVLNSIGKWELPTSFMSPPSNMDKLVSTTTAQLRAYTTLAGAYNQQSNYKESLHYSNEAEKRFNAIFYVSNHWLYGKFLNLHIDTYYGRANNLLFLASNKVALNYEENEYKKDFDTAVKFFEKIDYNKGIATALALKAQAFNKAKRYDKCNGAGKIALDYALKYDFLDFVWRIETLRGDTFLKLGQKDLAYLAYKRANDTINSLTGSLAKDNSKRAFGVGKDDITYNLIKLNIQNNDYDQLFENLENSRARAFVDMLSNSVIKVNSSNETLKDIYTLDKQIDKQRILNSRDITNVQNIKLLEDFISKRKLLVERLKKEDPVLSTTISIWSNSLKNTQNMLEEDESIVYFLPLKNNDKISYLKIRKDEVIKKDLDITYKQLDDKLSLLLRDIGVNTKTTRGLKVNKKVLNSKMKISVKDIDNDLNTKDIFDTNKTYIVSSNNIYFVPWGMLNSKRFSLLPNGSWLNFKDLKQKTKKDILVFANPNFGGELAQLDGANEEAIKVANIFNVKPFLGDNATKENLYNNIKEGVDILHFATHGVFYKNNPLNSSVILSKNSLPYYLSAKEIYQNPLKANLVVLSACHTGLGEVSNSNDIIGLNRSFFINGTKTILSSLWAIDDIGTKEFMSIFYKYAKNGEYSKGYIQARDYLKTKGYPSSVYGAFVLNGIDIK